MLKSLMTLIAVSASAFAMHYGELNVNDKDIEVQLNFDMGQFNYALDPESVYMGVRYLNVDEDHGDGDDTEELVELSYLMKSNVATVKGLSFGFGFKVDYLVDAGELDYLAIPLGVEASYRLPFQSAVPLIAGLKFYYAPEVLSLQDAERYMEYKVSLDAEVIDHGRITTGYRRIETDFTMGDATYNRAWFIGFKFLF